MPSETRPKSAIELLEFASSKANWMYANAHQASREAFELWSKQIDESIAKALELLSDDGR